MGKRFLFSAALVVLLVSHLCAQTPVKANVAQDYNANSVTFPVFSLNADPVPGANISLVGNPGPATWCYWAEANYQIGSVLSSLGCIFNAPNTLTVSNYVSISPIYPAGVGTVDILATQSLIPPVGACNCAVTTGLTSGAATQTSNTLSSYTVSILNPATFNLVVRNEVISAGITHLLLRNAYTGALVCDLSIGCGSGGVSGSGTPGTIPIWTGSTALGNSNLTQSGTVLLFSGTAINASSLNGGVSTAGTVTFTDSRSGNCVGAGFPFFLPGASGCQDVLAIERYNGASSSAQLTSGLFIAETPAGATNPATSVGVAGEAYEDQAATSLGVLAEAFQDVAPVSGQTNNWGLLALADNASGGTFPSNEAIRAQTVVGVSSTSTNDDTIHILAPTIGAGGAMTNHAGLKIDTQGTGSAIITGTDPISFGGPLTLAITGSTQCLQASSLGVVSGTGSACGSGGGSLPSGSQGNPLVNSSTGTGTTYSATPNEIHSSGFAGGTDLATILGTAAASPTPIDIVLDPSNTVMNVSNTGARVVIGSATQPVNVINRGQALQCTGTTGTDCIAQSQWGSLVCDAKGPGASSRGCFIGSSATANITSLVTNADHTGAQSQMKFTGHNVNPNPTSIVTHAAFWPVAVEGQGIFENLGIGCGGAGKVAVSIEDGPSSGDSNTDTFRSLNAFGSNFNGCIPLQVYATSTGSGSGQNILFDGGGAGDAVLAPVSLSTTAAVTVTGSPSTITVNNTTNLATNEQAFVSDGASSEYVIITSFVAATSITATFANTHSSGVTISTGLCWDSNGCMINIDGAAGGTGAQSVRNVHFNNFYAEGVTGAVSTANMVAVRNCQGCGFENFGFNGGPSVASAFKIGFSSVSTSAGFVTITAAQHGARFTNWINNTIDSYTLAAAGGDNFTYTYPGPPAKTSGQIIDGALVGTSSITASGVISAPAFISTGSGPGAPNLNQGTCPGVGLGPLVSQLCADSTAGRVKEFDPTSTTIGSVSASISGSTGTFTGGTFPAGFTAGTILAGSGFSASSTNSYNTTCNGVTSQCPTAWIVVSGGGTATLTATCASNCPTGSSSGGTLTLLTASQLVQQRDFPVSASLLATNASGNPTNPVTKINCNQATCATSATNIIASVPATAFYLIGGNLACTSSATATVSFTMTWTDPSSTVQTFTAAAANCGTLGSGSYTLETRSVIALSGTAIQYNVTVTGSPNYQLIIPVYPL